MTTPKYGRMTPAEYDRMCESIRRSGASSYSKQQQLGAARLLTDFPADRERILARAAAAADAGADDGLDEEFAHLWPGQPAERRRMAAASAARELTDDEIYLSLFPPDDGDE